MEAQKGKKSHQYRSILIPVHQVDHGIVSEKGEGKVVDCPKCDKRCSDKHALEKHMIKHTVEKNFVCNICGKRLKRQSSLDLHLRQHTGTKNYMVRLFNVFK